MTHSGITSYGLLFLLSISDWSLQNLFWRDTRIMTT